MITLIDQKQIRDYRSLTGVYLASGWTISGDVSIFGFTSGISGRFDNLDVGNLTVGGNSISNLAAFGTTVSGSGFANFLTIPNASGLNEHFRIVFATGTPSNSVQSFSSQDSQSEWQYFQNGSWSSFPALGLSPTQQDSSIIRLMFQPTGFDINHTYYLYQQIIYAGNITGNYINSLQFRPSQNGFTLSEIASPSAFLETADDRYARKLQIDDLYILSGVGSSGTFVTLPVYGALPSNSHGQGELISVSGRLYQFVSNSYQPVANITGFSVASGGIINVNPIFSGMGNTVVQIVGTNIIGISGAINSITVSGSSPRIGNIIFATEGGSSVREVQTSSGNMIIFSGGGGNNVPGGITGIGVNNGPFFTGAFGFSGTNNINISIANFGNSSGIVISGINILNQTDRDQLFLETWQSIGY